MASETKRYPDPLIDEVRERRRQIWDECDHDFDKLFDLLRRFRAEHPENLVDRRKSKRKTLEK
jgi:hypothetical protein